MFKDIMAKLASGENLSEQEVMTAMNFIMEGSATQAQIGAFIIALRLKGETIEEITGCAKVMREKAEKIKPEINYFIDTCGTGGDCSNTFNISTAAAIVAAASGVYVAKHGNRSASSKSGSADVLEALGINIQITPDKVKESIEKTGIGFMFAQSFHKSMKHVAGVRKELGIRTIFNILGPLTNPANAEGQILGVFDGNLTETLANVLLNLGVKRAMVIHGSDGLDEITTTGTTKVSEVRDGKVLNYDLSPDEYGLLRASKDELVGGDSIANAEIIKAIFNGEKGPKRDIVILNAAAAMYIGENAVSIDEGIKKAIDIIDTGKALSKLNEFRDFTVNAAMVN